VAVHKVIGQIKESHKLQKPCDRAVNITAYASPVNALTGIDGYYAFSAICYSPGAGAVARETDRPLTILFQRWDLDFRPLGGRERPGASEARQWVRPGVFLYL
jgi:hypothetical protein